MVLVGISAITTSVLLMPFGFWAALVGAVSGGFAGRWYERKLMQTLAKDGLLQRGFFRIAGYICKRSGRVLPEHIGAAQTLIRRLDLSLKDQKNAVASFNEGKAMTSVTGPANRLRTRAPSLLRFYMGWELVRLTRVAPQSLAAETALREAVRILGLPRGVVALVKTPEWEVPDVQPAPAPVETAFDILGVSPGTEGAALKQAYRQAISRHHPDKIAAAGGSEDEIQAAKEESQRIHQAWESLKKQAAR